MRFLQVNVGAVLVELRSLPETLALLDTLTQTPIPGIEELVPAAQTLLIRFDPRVLAQHALVTQLGARELRAAVAGDSPLVDIEVRYDGEDLGAVAEVLGTSVQDVISRHTEADYQVAFTGFAPGFAYLSASVALQVPRRTSPRVKVPAGSVALAGEFSAVYPKDSPGGWQLIGQTDALMWDLQRPTPALLQPGFRVRFHDAARARPVGGARANPTPRAPATPEAPAPGAEEGTGLVVQATGIQAVFQDEGRYGQARQGVSTSGGLDRTSMRAANRIVGNPFNTAVIESVGGGLELMSQGPSVLAVTGASGGVRVVSSSGHTRQVPRGVAFGLNDGDTVRLEEPTSGLRSYVAVQGIEGVPVILGSASTDTLSGVGPPPLQVGTRVRVARSPRALVGAPEEPGFEMPTRAITVHLDVVVGPRSDWFTRESVDRLFAQRWTVTPLSNRVGLRLKSDATLTRARTDELPSEGTIPGSIQVPPNGEPVIFMADHPLTGGYPVIAAVAPYHLDVAGQIPIGAQVQFRPIRIASGDATTRA